MCIRSSHYVCAGKLICGRGGRPRPDHGSRTGRPTGRVCGIDVSDSMLTLAQGRAVPAGSHLWSTATVAWTRCRTRTVLRRGGLHQVLECVADIPAALASRVLRLGGRLLVLDTDWDSTVWHSTDPDRMRRVLLTWDQHLADPFCPARWAGRCVGPGSTSRFRRCCGCSMSATRPPPSAAGRSRSSLGSWSAVMGGPRTRRSTAGPRTSAHSAKTDFFSLNRYVFCATRPQ